MANVMIYGTPTNDYHLHYENRRLFPEDDKIIETQLPPIAIAIQMIAAAAFTALYALFSKSVVLYWPIVIFGAACIGLMAYHHLIKNDPLVDVFYRIMGGQDRFEQLPEIRVNLAPDQKLVSFLKELRWNDLNDRIYRAKTCDGRNIMIVKGLSRLDEGYGFTRKLFAFVEKIGPEDGTSFPFVANQYREFNIRENERNLNGVREVSSSGYEISSSMTSTLANEFFAQMNQRV